MGRKKQSPDVAKIVRKARKEARKNFLQNLFFNHLKMMYPDKKFHYEYYFPNGYTWYLLDIAIPKERIDIEVDGKKYHSPTKDRHRDNYIKSKGWKVIRVDAKHVLPIVRGDIEFNL